MPAEAPPEPSIPDVFDILIQDHKKIIQFFDEFRNIKDRADDETKQTLVEVTCTELVIHGQIEEEFLYPALHDAFDDPSLVNEAGVEHIVVRQLIGDLESMHPDDDLYDAKFTVLGEYMRHHIEKVENKLFPQARKTAIDLDALGKDLLRRRDELRTEFGIPDEGYEEGGDDGGFHPHRKWRTPHHH